MENPVLEKVRLYIMKLEEKNKKEINSCRGRWENKRSTLISQLVESSSFENDEVTWLHYHSPNYSSSLPSNALVVVPTRVLKNVIEGNSNGISNWVMYKIPADKHFKFFWWSIPICLIAWIWIHNAWIGILIALAASIIRNVVLENRSERDYQNELAFHKYEIDKFNQLASQLSENVKKLNSNMEAEINELKNKHRSAENEIKSKRDKELSAINNGIVTKFTSKSFGCEPHAKKIIM